MIQSKFKYILANAFKIRSSPYVRQIGRQQVYIGSRKLLTSYIIYPSLRADVFPTKERELCKFARTKCGLNTIDLTMNLNTVAFFLVNHFSTDKGAAILVTKIKSLKKKIMGLSKTIIHDY